STMPKSIHLDHYDTAYYIPMYHRTGGFSGHEREVYKSFISRLINEGRVIDFAFLDDQPNLRSTFTAIGINKFEITLSLVEFARILKIPSQGVCVHTPEWRISSLQNGVDTHPDIYPPPHEDSSLIHDNIRYLILFSYQIPTFITLLYVILILNSLIFFILVLPSVVRRTARRKREKSGLLAYLIREMEPDIENMTISKYLDYEATKERRLWDDVRSRRSPTNYNEADVDAFHWNKSKTFIYLYYHNLTPPHPCFLPVQPYPKNYLLSTNESNDVDIENMTIAEYNLYVAKQSLGMNPLTENIKRMGKDIVQDNIWDQDDDLEEDREDDSDDGDTFDMWDITVEDVEQIRKFFNVLDEIDEIVQPLIPEPIHTTTPNDDYVAPTTKSILDKLLGKFEDEILNVTMVDDEADFNPTKDLEELERLLAKEP
ncbi:hypothetical protein Tco_0796084, partial [Tanacetum coccineum]